MFKYRTSVLNTAHNLLRWNSTDATINSHFHNRNPRNLERLRIAYKPSGWHLEKPGRCFWHKLQITESSRYIIAKVVHFDQGPILEASSSEWAIKKQLYRPKDTSAYNNLGKILAQRCLQAGITEIYCDITSVPEGKIDLFLKSLKEGGVVLTEPTRITNAQPWDRVRPEKPWEVIE